ncbi:MAG: hypothetical protein IPP61_11270 [Cytophagaceae bacterium]|nr:hypothetical protein [Cytophagaceae bacterium]MBL0302914.1 hypothetical protein [Cytophagaceae bacterium]MBL0325744.1 hypothetical protein [Cytophagaceae bacterium]
MLKQLLEKKGNAFDDPLSQIEILTLEKEMEIKINVPEFKFPQEFKELLSFAHRISINTFYNFKIPGYPEQIDLITELGSNELHYYFNFKDFEFDNYENEPIFHDFSNVFCVAGCHASGLIFMGHKGEYLNQIYYLVPYEWDSYPEFIKLADSLTEFIDSLYE